MTDKLRAIAEQEPVAWQKQVRHKVFDQLSWVDVEEYVSGWNYEETGETRPLYTTPPRREWRGLADEERLDAFDAYLERTPEDRIRFRDALAYKEEEREAFDAGFAAAERALREKNA